MDDVKVFRWALAPGRRADRAALGAADGGARERVVRATVRSGRLVGVERRRRGDAATRRLAEVLAGLDETLQWLSQVTWARSDEGAEPPGRETEQR